MKLLYNCENGQWVKVANEIVVFPGGCASASSVQKCDYL